MGGLVFLEIILILAFALLNTEVQAIAAAEAATAIETLFGLLFPYVFVFVILFFGGAIVYEAIK